MGPPPRRRARRTRARQQIAALARALAEAERLLHHDDLTPLLNRRGFRRACDRWAGERHDAQPATCVMIDLDGFKAINDRHGHPAGDAALIHFAAILRPQLRPVDTVARLGGDEFALILPRCRGNDGRALLERLQQALVAAPLALPGGTVALRFSAGVAECRADEPLRTTLARADAALLEAKRLGKSMVRLAAPPVPVRGPVPGTLPVPAEPARATAGRRDPTPPERPETPTTVPGGS